MSIQTLAMAMAGFTSILVAASLLRQRLIRWRFRNLTREFSGRWRQLDQENKRGVLRLLGVSTLRRVPAPVLDGLYAGVLASARASLRESCDLDEVEMHLRLAFARHQGDGRSRAAMI